MSSHTLHLHNANHQDNKPVADSQHIEPPFAAMLRRDYRRLRRAGVSRALARTALHSGFVVGSVAAHNAERSQRIEVLNRGAA